MNKGSNQQIGVSQNYSSGQRTVAPRITTTNDRCRIVHRELVGNVNGTTNFSIDLIYPLNPGIGITFPWLSLQAQGWEKYHFNRLTFKYYTRTSTTTIGSIMLIPDYDASDVAPLSETIAASYHGVVEDAPWKDITLNCDNRLLNGDKFVRQGTLPANNDIKLYDAGNLFIGTTDGNALTAWGKLWVEYDITFINQQLNPTGGLLSVLEAYSNGSTPTNIFGTTGSMMEQVCNGPLVNTIAGNTISISGLTVGQTYSLNVSSFGTTFTAYTLLSLTGASNLATQFTGFNSGSTFGCDNRLVVCTNPIMVLNYTVAAAAISQTFVVISQMPIGVII